MQDDRHEDLWHFSAVTLLWALYFLMLCLVYRTQAQIRNHFKWCEACFFFCKSKSDKTEPTLAVIYCLWASPGNASPLHWQEVHRLLLLLRLDEHHTRRWNTSLLINVCIPSITAYHKLAAAGPCMGCVGTSAMLHTGSNVVPSTSQSWPLA